MLTRTTLARLAATCVRAGRRAAPAANRRLATALPNSSSSSTTAMPTARPWLQGRVVSVQLQAPQRTWSSEPHPADPKFVVTADQVAGWIAAGNKAKLVLIDVREPDEYAAGHLPTAVNIPLGQLPAALNMAPAKAMAAHGLTADPTADDTKVVVYCRSGVRAEHARLALLPLDIHARNFKGSFLEWSERHPDKVVVPK